MTDKIELARLQCENTKLKLVLKNIEAYVKPSKTVYPTLTSIQTEVIHSIICFGRGGTMAKGRIVLEGKDDAN